MSAVAETDLRDIQCFTNEVVRVADVLGVLADDEVIPLGFNCWRVMTKHDGDKRVVWDARNIAQIAEAKKLFEKLKREGMKPFRVGTNGAKTSEEMTEFDPHAEEVIFMQMKHVVGG